MRYYVEVNKDVIGRSGFVVSFCRKASLISRPEVMHVIYSRRMVKGETDTIDLGELMEQWVLNGQI